jgi:YVTN family beta-propeller protein
MAPNGAKLYVANGNGGSVSAVNTVSKSIVSTMMTGAIPTSLAVSADSSTVYVTNAYGYSVSIIAAATNIVTTIPRLIVPLTVVLSH